MGQGAVGGPIAFVVQQHHALELAQRLRDHYASIYVGWNKRHQGPADGVGVVTVSLLGDISLKRMRLPSHFVARLPVLCHEDTGGGSSFAVDDLGHGLENETHGCDPTCMANRHSFTW